jgi:hypothetical protein
VRRLVLFVTAAGVAVGLLGAVPAPAGAQTGDVTALCAARIEANNAQGKAANLAAITKMLAAAPESLVGIVTQIRDAYKQQGDKFFNTEQGLQLVSQVDTYTYDNCPGTQVPVTAIDYQFQGMPTTLPAGATKFKLTNTAPKEDHELIVFKLTPQGEAKSPDAILALPQKKARQYVDQSVSTFMFAPPGQSGYGLVDLQPGKYLYACFLPQGGKKKGTPHFKLGMEGTFTVS